MNLGETEPIHQRCPLCQSLACEEGITGPGSTVIDMLDEVEVANEEDGDVGGECSQCAQLPIFALERSTRVTRGEIDVDDNERRAGVGGVGKRGKPQHLHPSFGTGGEGNLRDAIAARKLGGDDGERATTTAPQIVVKYVV